MTKGVVGPLSTVEGIGAGEINDLDIVSLVNHPAGLLFDRDAGVVGNMLPCPCDRVEQSCFAGIRVPCEGNGQLLGHGSEGSTSTRM